MKKTIMHFGVNIRKTDRLLLNRDNYCTPSNKVSSKQKVFLKKMKVEFPNKIYDDIDHYNEEYVKGHYKDCMLNYDLNMKYFESLDKEDFNCKLLKFITKNAFIEVKDLNNVKIDGIYILVLDNYKQIYIGISENIKQRVMNHWSKKKDFDRLIFGDKYTSVLSIDSFGALDTTRIYYKHKFLFTNKYKSEEKLVKQFDKKYLINRVAGGINDDEDCIRNLKLFVSRNKREL